MTRTQYRLAGLQALGFDLSYIVRGALIEVKCSQCQAATVNGFGVHETGCPNARHECKGCNNLIPTNQRYCEDCQ